MNLLINCYVFVVICYIKFGTNLQQKYGNVDVKKC